MSRTDVALELTENLANNVRFHRKRRALTQAKLAKLAGIPRPTLALVESGSANPTLAIMARLSGALQVTIDELLTPPKTKCQVYRRGTLPIEKAGVRGDTVLQTLLPDPIPGLGIQRMELQPGARLTSDAHAPGTREYIVCESGVLMLFVEGEEIMLAPGDVVAFPADQNHAYLNPGKALAIGFSVVAPALPGVLKA